MAASNGSEYYEVEIEGFAPPSNAEEDEEELMWAAIVRLPSQKQRNYALLRRTSSGDEAKTETIDVRKLSRSHRELVVKKALASNDQDNYRLLSAIKERLDRVGLEVPKVEVRLQNLTVATDVKVGSRALPTLINATRDVFERVFAGLRIFKPKRHSLTILNDVSAVVKPGRLTLLLGPPGSGKSTLLLALAGKLDGNLNKSGSITYNGWELDEFQVQRASAYIGQTDNHIAELTVRETLDFAARCQGANDSFAAYIKDLTRLEKERHIRPNPEIDAFMKASSVGGKKHSVSTDYVLNVLGLDLCSDTVVGSEMLRGVSGGQKKRVTTGEMIVGPRKTLFMDEISTGLDSSTTYQIVKCVRNFVHQMDATALMALLQPPPETFELFDDLVLLSDGYLVYQGPRAEVLEFFESLGFRLPPRKGVADFLQEVTSKKDQAKYWADTSKPYVFLPVSEIANAFKSSRFGKSLESSLAVPFDKSKSHPSALATTKYAVSKWELFRTCFAREILLISRHRFFYMFRTCQRDNYFHPAWAWSIASWILRVPLSIIEAVVWSCIVYYTLGFAPGAGRFFRYMLLLFSIHQMALGLYRMMASIARDMVIANTFGSASMLAILLLGGFIIPKESIKSWWIWMYWVSPLSYGQSAISVNEFTATRWMKKSAIGNNTVGYNVLHSHSLPTDDYWYWLGVGVMLLYAWLFNNIMTLALAYLNPLRKSQVVIQSDDQEENSAKKGVASQECELKTTSAREDGKKKGMIMPFHPLTMTFHNISYYVDTPQAMRSKGIHEKKLQLLSNVSGIFSPGVLTALVGSSGAGKTTLMDVLAGRKTGGYIEGDIKLSGYPKEQSTFARISGYVEQEDVHSPQVTIEESLWFSANLRLPKEISKDQRHEFVEEVMSLVELDSLRHALVGSPGSFGLSTEQRKRLTIAVELVANPSIIFMDEPTSGLDARAAAIVMRAVRNTVDTGRTVVCTIHQPSIEIFEAFDEGLDGIPLIPSGYNPATWVLEVTTTAVEEKLGVDFANVYKNSEQYREVESSIKSLSVPPDDSEPLKFASTYSQNWLSQFFICLWKQNLVYWRSPQYNAVRLAFTTVAALILGSVFWDVGSQRDSSQSLFMVMGALYASCLFLGVNNAASVQPIVSIERTVFYREKAAGMYSPIPFAAAQGLVEIPYVFVQTLLFGVITYFMVNFERTMRKFLLYLVFTFLTFSYFTFFGMMVVGLTPNQHLAAIISSAFYSLSNLLSGFLVPQPSIPGWWIWFYYISPVAWTLRGIISSQLGDVETMIVEPTFRGTVKEYLKESLGYGPGMVGASAAVLVAFSVFFFGIFAFSVKFLNFQRR
ncbi:ABC transporter G family member 31 [Citrus sinensis]|uniref:ABC transporter G family member 31 n=1 Tax=Citrus sinensis TaxID=2711 RepID=A0ACB8IWD2_CITSI|nr:ABC transporter G family member 31 [Citrus sinensis]